MWDDVMVDYTEAKAMRRNEYDANMLLAQRAAERKAIAEALRGRNRAHTDKRKAQSKGVFKHKLRELAGW